MLDNFEHILLHAFTKKIVKHQCICSQLTYCRCSGIATLRDNNVVYKLLTIPYIHVHLLCKPAILTEEVKTNCFPTPYLLHNVKKKFALLVYLQGHIFGHGEYIEKHCTHILENNINIQLPGALTTK